MASFTPDFTAILKTLVDHGVEFIEEVGHEKDLIVLPTLRRTLEEKSKK